MSSPWKKSPNVRPRMKNKAWIFVNSFSFNFLEFLAKIYWANFFPWAEKAKKGRYTGNRTGPTPETGWAGHPSPIGPGGPLRRFAPVFPGLLLLDFLLRLENFKESFNKKNEVPRVFLFGLFIWPNWELGNPSHQAYFCTHAAAMESLRSLELKQGAKEPSMEERSDASSSYPSRSRGPPASVAEGVSRSELSHLATPSKRRSSLSPFEGQRASKA
jgi:hypothetical protein